MTEKAKRWIMRPTPRGDVMAETVHKEWDDSARESDLAANYSGLGLAKVYVLATDYDALTEERARDDRDDREHRALLHDHAKLVDALRMIDREVEGAGPDCTRDFLRLALNCVRDIARAALTPVVRT